MTPNDGELRFIGNATVLLRYAGLTILTDPNFIHRGEQVALGYGLTATRLTDPAIEIDELPALDAVVLSHYHGDHFDQVAEERLARETPILTTPQAADALRDKGFQATVGLDIWQEQQLRSTSGHLRVTALPGKHAPAGLSIALPDVMGSCLDFWRDERGAAMGGQPDLRLYITGDTIWYEGLREIGERMPRIDLALLHLGGTRVMGLTVTMDAEQGLELLRAIRPSTAMPIHYDDYDAFNSPLSDFQRLVREAGLEPSVRYVDRGEVVSLEHGATDRQR